MLHPEFLIYGAAGAASLELLKLYDYKEKLSARKYRGLLRSWLFWLTVLGMIFASGFIAWAMNAERPDASIWQVVVTGIAARTIVREIATAKEAASPTKLGGALRTEDEEKSAPPTLRDIFQ